MKKWLSALLAALTILMMPLATMEEAMEIVTEVPEEATVEEVVAPEGEEDIEVVPAPVEEAEFEEEDIEVVAAPVEEEIFQIEDGVMVAYNGTDETVEIPDGVVTIAAWAFAGNNIVKKVICPDSVETIEDFAFYGCAALEAIVYGNEVEVGVYAFEGCDKLTAEEELEEEIVEEPAEEESPVAEEETIPEETKVEVTEEDIEQPEIPDDEDEEAVDRRSKATVAIKTQPSGATVLSGKEVMLKVGATGTGLTYQWEYQTATSNDWIQATSAGAKTASWTFTSAVAHNGRKYRVVVTDQNGNKATSNTVTLTVVGIAKQPVNIKTVAGAETTLEVSAVGNSLTYQWEYQASGSTTWTKASSDGAKTASWTFKAGSAHNGRKYRVTVKDTSGLTVTSNAVTLSVSSFGIIEQPANTTVAAGQNATLSVTAGGSNLTYQWQYQASGATTWTNASSTGAKAASWTFSASVAMNGRKYRVIVKNTDGNQVTSNAVTLTVKNFGIVTQPVDIIVKTGNTVNLSVGTVGSGLSYQWEYQTSGASVWTKATSTGAKTANWTFTAATVQNGRKYRVVVTDKNGNTATSNAATVNVVGITSQPKNVTTVVGANVTLSVVAKGSSLSYQWEYQAAGSSTWVPASSAAAKTSSWTFTAASVHDGRKYRVVITDKSGIVVMSNTVTLTVKDFGITKQPVNTTAYVGESVTLSVSAAGKDLTYQWQYQASGSNTWTSASSDGAKTANWTFTAATAHDGRKYHVIVTDKSGNKVTSNTITLTVRPQITKQPVDQTVIRGASVTLDVSAKGTGLTYQWQYQTSGTTTWTNASSDGAKTASWTFTAIAAHNGRKYRVIVTDANGKKATSNAATLTVKEFGIVKQPVNTTTTVGASTTLSVTAAGSGLTYQWQYQTSGSTAWTNASSDGAKTASWTFTAGTAQNGRKYRVIVKDASGDSVTSNAITLTVKDFGIVKQPVDITVCAGDSVILSVTTTGTGLTYQWQYQASGSTTWTNASSDGAKTNSWTFKAADAMNGRKYRVIVKGSDGSSTTSDEVTLTITDTFTDGYFTYRILSTSTVSLIAYSGSAKSVVVPQTVKSRTVVEIGEEAFMGNTKLTTIDLPDTITVIRARAFKNCTSLTTMN